MRLKVKENITLWRNEGLIAYVALGFLCYFFYGGQRSIAILSSAKYIFRNADELHGLQYVIFACFI